MGSIIRKTLLHVLVCCSMGASAQTKNSTYLPFAGKNQPQVQNQNWFTRNGICTHLGAGIEVGTTGIGFEVGTPVTNWFQIRAGMSILPSFSITDMKADLDISDKDWEKVQEITFYRGEKPTEVTFDGHVSKIDAKFLVDFFPIKKSSFHVTTGFYWGNSHIIEVNTTNNEVVLNTLTLFNNLVKAARSYADLFDPGMTTYILGTELIGVKMCDHMVYPSGKEANAYIKVNNFKPYFGVGFGRVVPKKTRLSFACDIGFQIWNIPRFVACQPDGDIVFTDAEGDGADIVKVTSRFKVYPCINFRLTGRIF